MIHQGEILRRELNVRAVSVAVFAREIGVSREYAYSIFKQEYVATKILGHACKAYGIPIDIFFYGNPQPQVTVYLIKGEAVDMGDTISLEKKSIIATYQIPGGAKKAFDETS